MPRLDDRWGRGGGLDGFAEPGETPRQGGLADKRLRPALLQQLRFGDHAVAVFQEIEQDLKHFRLQGQAVRAMPQLSPSGIQRVVMKAIYHAATVLLKSLRLMQLMLSSSVTHILHPSITYRFFGSV